MRLLLTADWHLDRGNRLDDFVKSVTYMVTYAVEHSIPRFIILGDLYRDWRASPVERDVLHRLLVKLHKHKIETTIILGNHDVDDKNTDNKLTAAQELDTLRALNVKVIAEPCILPAGDKTILAVPHLTRRLLERERKKQGRDVAYLDILRPFAAHNPALVLGHMYLPEAVLGASDVGMESARAVRSEDLLGMFKAPIFLGDIHKPQQLHDAPPLVYVGSPDKINFGEADQTKRFVVYDLDTEEFTSHDIPTRNFIEIKADLESRTIHLSGSVSGDMPMGDGPYMDCLRAFLRVIGGHIKDSVVKMSVAGHKNSMDQILRTEVSDTLRTLGPSLVKSITFSVTDNTAVRDGKYSDLLSDWEAFSYWLGTQTYDSDMRAKVYAAAAALMGKHDI